MEKSKDEFHIDNKYCHITTFETSNKKYREISFAEDENYPIKACFSDEYKYIDDFFQKFIRFRNDLIRNKQVVKSDDIYQCFSSVTSFKEQNNKSIVSRIIKKIF